MNENILKFFFKLLWAKNNLSTIYLYGINWENMTWEGRTRITAKPCFHRFMYVATMCESFWTPLSINVSLVCCLARILLILVRIGNDSWCQTHPKVLIVSLVVFCRCKRQPLVKVSKQNPEYGPNLWQSLKDKAQIQSMGWRLKSKSQEGSLEVKTQGVIGPWRAYIVTLE